MKHFSRPNSQRWMRSSGVISLSLASLLLLSSGATAQTGKLKALFASQGAIPLLSSSQGYLGVELADVDAQRAQSLKLKNASGALITLIDHDAPAGQAGLKINDVVLELNGKPVERAEQLRHMLRETPAGHKVNLSISREGAVQKLTVVLADRKAVEHDVWKKIDNGGDLRTSAPAMGMLPEGHTGDRFTTERGFHLPFFSSSLNVGTLVEPLTVQMAEVLGVNNGLLIKHVARQSAAAAAGLQALDVILKVGNDPVTTLSKWERLLRANQGKTIQITILRDKKQQTVTLDIRSKRRG